MHTTQCIYGFDRFQQIRKSDLKLMYAQKETITITRKTTIIGKVIYVICSNDIQILSQKDDSYHFKVFNERLDDLFTV